MPRNPAEQGYQLGSLFDEIAELTERVAKLERAPATYAEEATVSAYAGGTQCTVTYDSGVTRLLIFASDYAPVVGHRVTILNHPGQLPPFSGIVLCRNSA